LARQAQAVGFFTPPPMSVVGPYMQYAPVSFFESPLDTLSPVPALDAKIRAGWVVFGLVKAVVTIEADMPNNRFQGISFHVSFLLHPHSFLVQRVAS